MSSSSRRYQPGIFSITLMIEVILDGQE